MSRRELEAVLFDADGVLQRRPGKSLRSALETLLPDASQLDAFAAATSEAELRCLAGASDFSSALAPLLERWRCLGSVSDVIGLWTQIEIDPGVLDVVDRVRASGLRVGLATNQWRERARRMCGELRYGDHFDELFFSCEVGAAKPDAEYFARVLRRLQLPPERVLFIDDHAPNVRAASELGIVAALFPAHAGAERLRRMLIDHGLLGCAADPHGSTERGASAQ